ncbi:MAG TPA: DUF3307 domain-containing protein [Solirubrobacteraceae bacterium]|jgi:hypothetical protein
MTWPAVLAAFLVCHLAGDFLLQTEWQALTKVQGLGTHEGRRALLSHVTAYTLSFLPPLIWVANDRSVLGAIGVTALIAVPHVVIDDGHLVARWMSGVKHAPRATPSLRLMVDQSFHIVCLLGAALLAAS